MKRLTTLTCMAVLGGSAALLPLALQPALAAEIAPNVDSPELIRQSLNQQIGKRVKVRLNSGQDLEGKLARVGAYGIVLTELTGQEFFEASVRLEQIAAVIARSAGK